MAAHSNILAWRNTWQRSLAGYSPWGHKESVMTESLNVRTTYNIPCNVPEPAPYQKAWPWWVCQNFKPYYFIFLKFILFKYSWFLCNVLISVVQWSDSAKHIYILFHIFTIIVYHRILNTVPKPNHFLIRKLLLSFLFIFWPLCMACRIFPTRDQTHPLCRGRKCGSLTTGQPGDPQRPLLFPLSWWSSLDTVSPNRLEERST